MSIESIDFSSAQSDINLGSNQYTKLNALTDIVVSGTISQNIKIFADNLTQASVESFLSALSDTPDGSRTITLTKNLRTKMPESLFQTATNKGWSVVFV